MVEISNTVVWFSLAVDYGLSFLSLGKPGTQGADAQLITGGLTAVESLLGTEIGAKQEGFVVDHGTSLMERFPVKAKDGSSIFAQFLLQTTKPGQQVDRSQVPLARTFVSELAKSLLETKLWADLQISAKLISSSEIFDYIIPVYEKINHDFKLKPFATLSQNLITNILDESFTRFEYSEVLTKLAGIDEESIDSYLVDNRSLLLEKFYKEVVSKFIQEFPLIFLYTSPKFIREIEKFILNYFANKCTTVAENILYDVIKEFFETTMYDIMQEFDIEKMKEERGKIQLALRKALKKIVLKNYPMLFLARPNLQYRESFDSLIDKRVLDKVFIEFDLGEILSEIAEKLVLEANPDDRLQANLVKGFFKNLALRFPGGLPDQLWNILIQLLKIYSAEAKVSLTSMNNKISIPDIHWTTLKRKLEQFQPNPTAHFRGGGEMIHFFEGVKEAIGRSFDQFYNSFIWNLHEEVYGEYFNVFNQECTRTFQAILTTKHIVALFNVLVEKFKLLSPVRIPFNYDQYVIYLEKHEFKGSRKMLITGFSEFRDGYILKFLRSKAEDGIESIESIAKSITKFQTYLKTVIKKVKEISQDRLPQIKIKNQNFDEIVNFTERYKDLNQKELNKIIKDVQRIIKTINQFSKLIDDLQAEQGSKKFIKKRDKVAETLAKMLEKFPSLDYVSSYSTISQDLDLMLEKEYQNAKKEYNKILEKEGIQQLKLKIKEGIVIPNENLEDIKTLYLKAENKRYKGDAFVTDTEFLYAFSLAFLFDTVDSNISKKAINLAIFDPKSSNLIQEVIMRGKRDRKINKKATDIFGHLKAELIETGFEIFNLSNTIVNYIKKSIVSENFPLSMEHDQYEILTLPINYLDSKFISYVEDSITIHPKIHLRLVKNNKVEVSLEVAQRPSVGEDVEYLMDAVALNVYNNELLRMSSYVESLKQVSSALGDNERRKVQDLLSLLGKRLTT